MAYRLVEKKFDDFDGKELPDNTRPWKVRFNGKEANVLVSAENRKKIEEFMGRILDSARQRPETSVSPAAAAKKKATKKATAKKSPAKKSGGKRDLTHVRTWLRENGHKVPDRGVLAQDLIDIYEAANKGTSAKKATAKKSPANKKTAKKSPAKKTASTPKSTPSAAASTATEEGSAAS